MKQSIWISLVLAVLLQELLWHNRAQASNEIVEAQGSVEIRRGNQRFQGRVGTDLEYGDLLRPAQTARIIVLCSNNTEWRVPSGRLSGLGNGCPVGNVRSLRGRGEDDFLAFLNQQFVYETQFLNGSLLLQWDPASDGSSYKVRVMQGEEIIWQQQVDRPEIQYAGPPLQPGVDYSLTVFPVPAAENPIATLSFQVLTPEQVTAVETKIASLPQDFSPEARAIALTRIYRDAGIPTNPDKPLRPGLVTEAIAALESLIVQGNSSAYFQRFLGDLYLQVGLLNQAEPHYQEAIALSTVPENKLERAAAQVGIASIRAAQGQLTDADRWLRLAKFNYALSGRNDRTELIDQWLARIALLQ